MFASREELPAKEQHCYYFFLLLQKIAIAKKKIAIAKKICSGERSIGKRVSMRSSLAPSMFLRRAQGMLQQGGQLQASLSCWLTAHASRLGTGDTQQRRQRSGARGRDGCALA